MSDQTPPVISVSLNTAVDRTLEVSGLAIGGHVRGRLVTIQPAGKAVNVARLLDILEVPCILTGFVGQGDRVRFKQSFAKSGVRVEMFEGREPTRENITLIDPKQELETHIRDAGSSLSADDLARLTKKLGIIATPGAYVVFAGSLPPGMSADAFAGLLKICRERGARVAVDSSGPGLEAVRRFEGLWMVKPNRAELAEIVGRPLGSDSDIPAAAADLRERIEQVVVTLGEEGAYLFCAEGAWRARPQIDRLSVVNTVGCGDALLAGFVKSHASGCESAECLRWGVAVGTASALQLCAGVVDPEDVKACYEKTEVFTVA